MKYEFIKRHRSIVWLLILSLVIPFFPGMGTQSDAMLVLPSTSATPLPYISAVPGNIKDLPLLPTIRPIEIPIDPTRGDNPAVGPSAGAESGGTLVLPNPSARGRRLSLRNVTYTLQSDVKRLDFGSITKVGDESFRLPAGDWKANDILLDETRQSALRIVGQSTTGDWLLQQAALSEVFQDFDIPDQTIRLKTENMDTYEVKPNTGAEAYKDRIGLNGQVRRAVMPPFPKAGATSFIQPKTDPVLAAGLSPADSTGASPTDTIGNATTGTSHTASAANPHGTGTNAVPLADRTAPLSLPALLSTTASRLRAFPQQETTLRLPAGTESSGSSDIFDGKKPAKFAALTKQILDQGGTVFSFDPGKELTAYLGDGQTIRIRVAGEVGMLLDLNPRWSAFSGYNISITGGQYVDMKVLVGANVNKEAYIPLTGISANAGSLGRIDIGLFLVCHIDGSITLALRAMEGTIVSTGVKGGTFFCAPTSFKPYVTHDEFAGVEIDPSGNISLGVYLTPAVSLTLCGMDVFGVEVRLGAEAFASASEGSLQYGAGLAVIATVRVVGKRISVLDMHMPLFSRSKVDRGNFIFHTGSLCVYRDAIGGAVFRSRNVNDTASPDDPFADTVRAENQKIELHYYKAGHNPNTNSTADLVIPLTTDARGLYQVTFKGRAFPGYPNGFEVKKGDRVKIAIPGDSKAQSDYIASSLPFTGIRLDYVDYYADRIKGEVLPGLDKLDLPGAVYDDVRQKTVFCKNQKVQILTQSAPKTLPNGMTAPGKLAQLEVVTNAEGVFDAYSQLGSGGSQTNTHTSSREVLLANATNAHDGALSILQGTGTIAGLTGTGVQLQEGAKMSTPEMTDSAGQITDTAGQMTQSPSPSASATSSVPSVTSMQLNFLPGTPATAYYREGGFELKSNQVNADTDLAFFKLLERKAYHFGADAQNPDAIQHLDVVRLLLVNARGGQAPDVGASVELNLGMGCAGPLASDETHFPITFNGKWKIITPGVAPSYPDHFEYYPNHEMVEKLKTRITSLTLSRSNNGFDLPEGVTAPKDSTYSSAQLTWNWIERRTAPAATTAPSDGNAGSGGSDSAVLDLAPHTAGISLEAVPSTERASLSRSLVPVPETRSFVLPDQSELIIPEGFVGLGAAALDPSSAEFIIDREPKCISDETGKGIYDELQIQIRSSIHVDGVRIDAEFLPVAPVKVEDGPTTAVPPGYLLMEKVLARINPDPTSVLGSQDAVLNNSIAVNVSIGTRSLGATAAPVLRNGMLLVPAGVMAKALGGTATWSATTKSVSLKIGAVSLKVRSGDTALVRSGKRTALPTAATVIGKEVYVPYSAFAQALGLKATLDTKTRKLTYTGTVR